MGAPRTTFALFPVNRPLLAESITALHAIQKSVPVPCSFVPATGKTGCSLVMNVSVRSPCGLVGTVWQPAQSLANNCLPVAASFGSIAPNVAGHTGGVRFSPLG